MSTRRSLFTLLSFLLLAQVRAQDDLSGIKGDFTNAKLVPDVLPAFEPTLSVLLTFDHEGFKIPVVPGVLLTINQTAAEPQIALKSSTNIEGSGFLVAMVDPDAPTPSDRSVSEVRHFLAANYVAGPATDGVHVLSSSTAPVGKYAGPGPSAPSEPHRYTFLVYTQPRSAIQAPTGEAVAPFLHFDLEKYIAGIEGLTLAGGTYFRVGPLGTVPNNGTFGADEPTSTGTGGAGTGTGGADAPGETEPPNGAASLKVGAGFVAVVAGVLAFVL